MHENIELIKYKVDFTGGGGGGGHKAAVTYKDVYHSAPKKI